MPRLREHILCNEALLGKKSVRLIHEILDLDSVKYGSYHRPTTHNPFFLNEIERMFGYEGKREAVFHLLLDWGVINKADYLPLIKNSLKKDKKKIKVFS
jgi:hypothetical protein